MNSPAEPAAPRTATSPADFPTLVVFGVLARLPYGMGAVGLLSTGVARDYTPTQTGLLAGAFTTTLAVAWPLWGRAADRSGLPGVLRRCVAINTVGTVLAVLGHGYSSLLAGAVLIAAGLPPVSSAMRTTWNRLLPEGPPRTRAAAFESVLADGVHIIGRLIVAVVGAIAVSAVLPLQAVLLALGAGALSRDPRLTAPPVPSGQPTRTAALLRRASPLFLLTLLIAISHGCVATAIVVDAPGTTSYDGPVLFSLWGVGSLLGGVLLVRLGRGRPFPAMVPIGLLAFAVLCVLSTYTFTEGALPAAAALVALGLPVAPTLTGLYLYASMFAPADAETTTYAVVNALIVVGFGIGSTVTGLFADVLVGARAGFLPAAVCSALAVPVCALGLARRGPASLRSA